MTIRLTFGDLFEKGVWMDFAESLLMVNNEEKTTIISY